MNKPLPIRERFSFSLSMVNGCLADYRRTHKGPLAERGLAKIFDFRLGDTVPHSGTSPFWRQIPPTSLTLGHLPLGKGGFGTVHHCTHKQQFIVQKLPGGNKPHRGEKEVR